ncbi:MAG: type II toxin-antitoxin system VapC family toxin [Desulfobacteraceae bacterium]|nr:MAG: type II toxin-antitoxin system VapC family toxin [Desulfobacteraceae bacterium]
MRAYLDSDILIWHLRGEIRALDFIRSLQDSHAYALWIGALQRAEIIFFMRPSEEADTLLFLSEFKTAPVDQVIVDEAGSLYRRWRPSHGIDINDAILAATVMRTGGTLFTLNSKHYPMPGIVVKKAW